MVNARKTLPNLSFPLSLAWLFLVACQPTVERLEDSAPSATRVRADFRLDVPQVMRGTVAQESILVGFEPVAVEGYGLVVGLNGTGCTTMPPDLRAHVGGYDPKGHRSFRQSRQRPPSGTHAERSPDRRGHRAWHPSSWIKCSAKENPGDPIRS